MRSKPVARRLAQGKYWLLFTVISDKYRLIIEIIGNWKKMYVVLSVMRMAKIYVKYVILIF